MKVGLIYEQEVITECFMELFESYAGQIAGGFAANSERLLLSTDISRIVNLARELAQAVINEQIQFGKSLMEETKDGQ